MTISCGITGATIAYTTDGSEPSATNGAQILSGATVHLTESATLKAATIASGCPPSAVTTATYDVYPPTGTNYQATILADSPTAYWRLNETSGTIGDNIGSTGSANDLTFDENGGSLTLGSPSPFDYLGNYLTLGGGARALDANGPSLVKSKNQSVEFWVKFTANATSARLVSSADHNWAGSSASGFDIYATGTMADGFNVGISLIGFSAKLGSIVVPGSTWTHVVVVQKAGTFRMYIDKELDSTTWGPNTLVAPQSGLALGYNVDSALGKYPMNGQLDEVAWYGYSLTDAQIRNHYNMAEGILQVEPPTFSPSSLLIYASPQQVTLDCATPGVTMYYTTDGSDPSPTNGTQYVPGVPIQISQTTMIRAEAVKNGYTASDASAIYWIQHFRPESIYYSTNVTVDGNLSEWASSDFVPLDQEYALGSGSAQLHADVPEAYYAAKWGPDNKLYVAIKVNDKYHVLTDGYGAAWNSMDSVDLYIHAGGTGPTAYMGTQADAQHYILGVNSDGNSVWAALGGPTAVPGCAGLTAAGKADGDWLYYEAQITPWEHFSMDCTGLILYPLSAGESIGIDVDAVSVDGEGYTGVLSENPMPVKYNDYGAIAHHLLVVSGTILSAKTSADGTAIGCSGIVTGVFDDCFYIESPDRTYGIRVQMSGSGLTLGQTVGVSGTVGTLDSGERCINATQVTPIGATTIEPLCLTNKALGGGDFGSVAGEKQPGVSSGIGLNNIGLYVKTTGQVGEKKRNRGLVHDRRRVRRRSGGLRQHP